MLKLRHAVALGLCTALLGACEHYGAEATHVEDGFELQRAQMTSAPDDVFSAGLHSSYLALAASEFSEGDYEVVRDLLEGRGPRGARGAADDTATDSWVGGVAMQPGGPQATGRYRGVPMVCFPGNPVSSQLSLEIFVAPLLRGIAGVPAPARGPRQLAHDIRSVPGKRQFLRGRALADGRVEQVAGPGSHLVAALAAADLLLVVPEDVTELPAGAEVETWEL